MRSHSVFQSSTEDCVIVLDLLRNEDISVYGMVFFDVFHIATGMEKVNRFVREFTYNV